MLALETFSGHVETSSCLEAALGRETATEKRAERVRDGERVNASDLVGAQENLHTEKQPSTLTFSTQASAVGGDLHRRPRGIKELPHVWDFRVSS